MKKHKLLFVALFALTSQISHAQIIKSYKNNGDVEVELSATNTNKLSIKGDKILQMSYPKGAMTFQFDKTDGSVYVHPENYKPFTLFLISKKGEHLSLTINSAESLGKTIEFTKEVKLPSRLARKPQNKEEPPFKKDVLSLVSHMEKGILFDEAKVQYPSRAVSRLKNGLVVKTKEIWKGRRFRGEVFEVYNANKKGIEINPSWFNDSNVKTIKVASKSIGSGKKTLLYRVKEVSHG